MKKGAQVLPLSAFDAKVLKLSRYGFTTVSQKMPFFKASLDIDEELRQKLLHEYEIGTIAIDDKTLRVAFSSLDKRDIDQTYDAVYKAAEELKSASK